MTPEELATKSKELHQITPGKLEIKSSLPLHSREDLSLLYTPGVGAVCKEIGEDKEKAYLYTSKAHSVAVISDGTAVLGLGNIGPEASLPVMEGKAIIFKTFANLDAWPIVLNVHSTEEIVATIKAISPGFGGINLEDIAAPQCFEVEAALQDLGIPVMHDDQHGTAIVTYAALLNACKITGRAISDLRVVINGAGAAGLAIAKMLLDFEQTQKIRVKDLIICDSKGIIDENRSDLNPYKQELLPHLNHDHKSGGLSEALKNADVFIGVSVAGALKAEHIKSMNERPMIFAMANPVPEIMPDEAKAAGAFIMATGRSDFPNQINNALVFPGVFKAAMQNRLPRITTAMKFAAAKAISESISPTPENLLPSIFDENLVPNIVKAIGEMQAS